MMMGNVYKEICQGESVRVSYCCKTVSRSNFWRKDFIVKMSLFVYTNDIFAINLTSFL